MKQDNGMNETDVKSFEAELSKIIQEVEENKKKQAQLLQENNQLRLENSQLKINDVNYARVVEENTRLKSEVDAHHHSGLSEKDLAEVMLNAKRVGNDIVQSAKTEALKFEREKQVAMNALRQEGNQLKEEIIGFKMQVNKELGQWVENLECLIHDLNATSDVND